MSEDVPDTIEHEIYVAAQAEVVWELVSRPGWWINEDEVDDHPVLSVEGDVATLTHPEWGDFAIRTVAAERPRQVSYRWLSSPGTDLDGPSTLVEFSVEDKPGGVMLRVVESGFAALSDDPEVCRAQHENNVLGWANELRAGRDFIASNR